MKSPDGKTTPSWYDDVEVPQFPPARASTQVDVCVVGAGIAGLTTAYLLLNEGKTVVVLDEGPIASGQTGRTSAHLASAIDDRFVEMEKHHGVEGSRLAYQSHASAIDTIERIAREEKIDCDFRRLDAFLSPIATDLPDYLDKEFAAAKRAGFIDIDLLDKGGMDNGRCIRFGNQARFQPLQYVVGLANAIKARGGRIYTGKRAMDVQGKDEKKHALPFAQLDGKVRVTAEYIVVATNVPSPINNWMGIYTKQAAYRTYMIGAAVPRGSVNNALYWDTGDPYHYVRLQHAKGAREDTLLIGGEDHKTGQFPEEGAPFRSLENWARKHFPTMGQITHRWSGQVQEPDDGVAFIGRAPTLENVFVITGDSGMGLTHSTLGAMLITDLIAGRQNPWQKLYDPSRKQLNTDFVKENANAMLQYKDLLTGGDVKDVDEIPRGHGAVMREGISKVAVYKDENDKVHKCSAICTHLQCVVQWNPAERSWDCPCHGSRFDAMGKVVMGPAVDDLERKG